MQLQKTCKIRGGGLSTSLLVVMLLCGSAAVFAAERSFCDLGAAPNPNDNTNGGFWSIANRANAVVSDSASSAVSVVTAPGSRQATNGMNLYSIPSGIIINFR